ncbi:MAG: M28 family peptidase [Acidobacteria bacterium]|nr:M28 family peptidase [Acidobacteriota bacterium]
MRGFSLLVILASSAPLAWSDLSSPAEYLEHVRHLSGDPMAGRGNGTPELDRAADYLARQFAKLGLQPLRGTTSFFQPFQIVVGSDLGPGNRMRVASPSGSMAGKIGSDFALLSFGRGREVEGALVFAGYGITAPEYEYDDYRGLDVAGKIVVVAEHEPQENDPASRFQGKELTLHAQFSSKVVNAKNHGAAALFLVRDSWHHLGEEAGPRHRGRVDAQDTGIVTVRLEPSFASQVERSLGVSFRELAQGITESGQPGSRALTGSAHLSVDARARRRVARNVVGYLPGGDPKLSSECVVFGAHYDHLGRGGQNSLAPQSSGQIHHGADDNASGTAGLLWLARAYATGPRPARSLLFIAFAGEELGLLGSAFYTRQPLFPLEQTVAMINLDMIGRLKEERVYVGGVGSAAEFPSLLEEANRAVQLRLDSFPSGYGFSDYTSFNIKSIPVLFFFSGLHSDYHRPSDTSDKINAAGAVRILQLAYQVGLQLASRPDRLAYVKMEEKSPASQGGTGYGAYFGSVPDFSQDVEGVRFADIRRGSPADQAGLKPQDVIVEFDGKKIQNLMDFTYVLRSHKPGDEVEVKVLRNGQPLTARVRLGVRR